MYILNGVTIDVNAFNTIDDMVYPPGLFADANERAKLGVIEVPNPATPEVAPTQVAELGGFHMADGQWTAAWSVRDKTQEELDAEKPFVPSPVTRRQARQALAIKGYLDKVETAIEAIDDGTPAGKQKAVLVKIEWQDSLTFERHRPLVIEIGKAIGLTSDDMDDLFRFAATL